MTLDHDHACYHRQAEKQLSIANTALDSSIKAIHLDLASCYEILRDQAAYSGPTNGPDISTPMRVTKND